jgi:hypothetical protein
MPMYPRPAVRSVQNLGGYCQQIGNGLRNGHIRKGVKRRIVISSRPHAAIAVTIHAVRKTRVRKLRTKPRGLQHHILQTSRSPSAIRESAPAHYDDEVPH